MYKSIWSLVFKCNGSGRQFNSIQFSQEYINQKNERKEKKRSVTTHSKQKVSDNTLKEKVSTTA
jgi:hypothetical protein